MSAPTMQSMMPPGAPSLPGQVNAIPRPPTVNVPTMVPGSTATPTSNASPSMVTPVMYQANPAAPTSGSFDGFNINTQAPEASH